MVNTILLRFGTGGPSSIPPSPRKGWVALARGETARHKGSDILVGDQCSSFEAVEAIVRQIRADLDAILEEARESFGPPVSN
jgi:hypothetical protein